MMLFEQNNKSKKCHAFGLQKALFMRLLGNGLDKLGKFIAFQVRTQHTNSNIQRLIMKLQPYKKIY